MRRGAEGTGRSNARQKHELPSLQCEEFIKAHGTKANYKKLPFLVWGLTKVVIHPIKI